MAQYDSGFAATLVSYGIQQDADCLMNKLRIEQRHATAFQKASYDLNPLHGDVPYARRSQFGRPVMYGMAAVLLALKHWSGERAYRLHSIQVLFRKPLFAGEEYDLHVSAQGRNVRLALSRGPVDYLVISIVADLWHPSTDDAGPSAYAFVPRCEAAKDPVVDARACDYQISQDAWAHLRKDFGINPRTMPAGQLATLLWASYCVGMEMPGRQALFSEFKAVFADEIHVSPGLSLTLSEVTVDERFQRYSLTGQGSGVRSFHVAAFKRPPPVDFTLDSMPDLAEGEAVLSGKSVFVSGSTRGFGAAFARMSALAGARVALNYRGDEASAILLRDELRSAGADAEIFRADMAVASDVEAMANAIAASFGPLDVVLDNAAPPIPSLLFAEQSPADATAFVAHNMSITANTVYFLAPGMTKSAQLVHVSSKYLLHPAAGFSHYLAAKSAQAALLRGIAMERPDIRVVVARLPRILTDQTNLAFDMDPPHHPGEVAKLLVRALGSQEVVGNYCELDLS